jgi:glycosyltransferase involved in cell wall biosynthesis
MARDRSESQKCRPRGDELQIGPMRVVLTGASLMPSYGGPAFSVSRLASALAESGVSVGLWAADQSARMTPLLPAKSPVRRLTGTEVEALDSFGRVDVLHDNGIWLRHNHRLARLAVERGIPRVVSTRGMLEPWAFNHKRWKKGIAWRLYQRRDLTLACCHHATSQREAQNLPELNLGVPVCMIPNGVDIPEFDPSFAGAKAKQRSSSGRKTALFLGRLYLVKGLPSLIEAWARVRPEAWFLRIAGPDEAGCRAQLEEAVSAAGLSEIVSFLGALDGQRKQSAFLDADLFILPTHSESFGMVIAEALAHGLPVLTTTGAPWPRLVEHDCGWWVEPTVEGMVAGLRTATSCDPDALHAMGMRGRAFVAAEFRWDRVARQFVSTYEELVAKRPNATN